MADFDLFIGIDYSGAETPTSRLKWLQVYAARLGDPPRKQHSPERDSTLPRLGRYDLPHAHKSSGPADRASVDAFGSTLKGVKN